MSNTPKNNKDFIDKIVSGMVAGLQKASLEGVTKVTGDEIEGTIEPSEDVSELNSTTMNTTPSTTIEEEQNADLQ